MGKSKIIVHDAGSGMAKMITSETKADMNRKPDIMVQPGHWNYLLTKLELAFVQSTDIKLQIVEHLYWYNDRYKFFRNWKLNYMLLRVSENITTEDIYNMDIPISSNPEGHYWCFNIKDLKTGDYIISLDEKDDLTVYTVL